MAAGATAARVAERMAISLRTLQRWRRQFAGDGDGGDRRKGSVRHVAHRLSQQERQQILAVCNKPQYASLRWVPFIGQSCPIKGTHLTAGSISWWGTPSAMAGSRPPCLPAARFW